MEVPQNFLQQRPNGYDPLFQYFSYPPQFSPSDVVCRWITFPFPLIDATSCPGSLLFPFLHSYPSLCTLLLPCFQHSGTPAVFTNVKHCWSLKWTINLFKYKYLYVSQFIKTKLRKQRFLLDDGKVLLQLCTIPRPMFKIAEENSSVAQVSLYPVWYNIL